jgi:hypothetical protein
LFLNFWSAALFRRFCFFVFLSRSKNEKTKAAEKRRTPKIEKQKAVRIANLSNRKRQYPRRASPGSKNNWAQRFRDAKPVEIRISHAMPQQVRKKLRPFT